PHGSATSPGPGRGPGGAGPLIGNLRAMVFLPWWDVAVTARRGGGRRWARDRQRRGAGARWGRVRVGAQPAGGPVRRAGARAGAAASCLTGGPRGAGQSGAAGARRAGRLPG